MSAAADLTEHRTRVGMSSSTRAALHIAASRPRASCSTGATTRSFRLRLAVSSRKISSRRHVSVQSPLPLLRS
jgi:hypothetical protein